MKIFLWLVGIVVAIWVAARVVASVQQAKLASVYPRADDQAAAMKSQAADLDSLFNLRQILPPGAMSLRTTIGLVDANPIGGNAAEFSGPDKLATVQRWSPLGAGFTW